MARTNNLTNFLTDVASAIKTKKGDSTPIPASNFDTEITNLPSGGGYDWSKIGYSAEPKILTDGLSLAEKIYNDWDSSTTSMQNMFRNRRDIIFMPLIDTSNVTNMNSAFNGTYIRELPPLDTSNVRRFTNMLNGCVALVYVPILDFSNGGKSEEGYFYEDWFKNIFAGIYSLSDEALDNILVSLLSATYFAQECSAGNKTIKYTTGLTSNHVASSRWQSLPHYQDFIDAGWTIGY